jgi:hypothetical protein
MRLPRFVTPTLRVRRIIRVVGLIVIVFGPIADGAWAVHSGGRILVASPEVPVAAPATRVHGDEDTSTPARRVHAYVAQRDAAIDLLLPEGRGGTHFFEDLGPTADGLAFPGAAAIAVSASVVDRDWPEAVELHERAHLLDAFLPEDVARVMARMAPAAHDEYAATNRGEHFGEMAAKAWQIVSPPKTICIDGALAARLEADEARVPGTSGFVLRYLDLLPARFVEDTAELRTTAERLSAPARNEWAALWRGVDARRRPDGTFEPWSHLTIRAYLEARRAGFRTSDHWIDRIASLALLPSLTLVRAAGG